MMNCSDAERIKNNAHQAMSNMNSNEFIEQNTALSLTSLRTSCRCSRSANSAHDSRNAASISAHRKEVSAVQGVSKCAASRKKRATEGEMQQQAAQKLTVKRLLQAIQNFGCRCHLETRPRSLECNSESANSANCSRVSRNAAQASTRR